MKFPTALLLGFCIASFATAGPITFINRTLIFTFKADTNDLVNGDITALPCCSQDLSTPIARTNFFTIGSITGTPPPQISAVFVNPLQEEAVTAGNPAYAAYDLSADVSISSLPGAAFQAVVNPPSTSTGPTDSRAGSIAASFSPAAAVPESSTFTLLAIGVGCLLIGKFRRKAM